MTEIQVLTKDFTSTKIRYNSLRKRKCHNYQTTTERSPLIHGQINFIEFVESNEFDNYTAKFETFLCDQFFKK